MRHILPLDKKKKGAIPSNSKVKEHLRAIFGFAAGLKNAADKAKQKMKEEKKKDVPPPKPKEEKKEEKKAKKLPPPEKKEEEKTGGSGEPGPIYVNASTQTEKIDFQRAR